MWQLRKLEAIPDHELDWRNEECPCIRVATDFWGNPQQVALTPDHNSMVSQEYMEQSNPNSIHWSEDPTYNMAIRKPRKRRL